MAAGAGGGDFDSWISEKFVTLNTDEDVFGPYIKSIVEGDETLEEKIDALDGILSELGDGTLNVEEFRQEILTRWDQHVKASSLCSATNGVSGDAGGLESKLESILKMNDHLTDTQNSNAQDSEKGPKGLSQVSDSKLRAAILNQCQNDSEDDSEDAGPTPSSSGTSYSGLERNTNVERVQSEIKDKREREKEAAAKKREKDREDRAKQKQQQQERKEKAKKKATKVERKR